MNETERRVPRRRQRRASVTLLCRANSWDNQGDPHDIPCEDHDYSPDAGNFDGYGSTSMLDYHNTRRTPVYRRRASVGHDTPVGRTGHQGEAADRVPRRPRRSSCMGSTTSSGAMAMDSKPDEHAHASLGDSFGLRKDNDFRPIRPRRSSIAMYETGSSGCEPETPFSRGNSDESPIMPKRFPGTQQQFLPEETNSLGKRDYPTVSPVRSSEQRTLDPATHGNVCFPAQA